MYLYDSPQNLVLLVNATPEEETAIGEELGIMGCRKPGLRIVGYETPSKDRCDQRLYYISVLQMTLLDRIYTGKVA